ncbi:hypothetical protein [Phyllobacterium zundukense]|uniref:Uncharacterized protein n=1 Tax=Phyllobacterium zundukense TaxID=1867719 RepID=A0ACD4CZU1_9HYPH|nr:hypothetical protein [Phyllobacterium zundukense]UXN59152.1 hypothetical protein N8E88_09815 [Phyllobacterium zundukense]
MKTQTVSREIVMKLFDQGLRDDLLIAARAAEQEHTATKIANERTGMVS